ncbi:HNH endonuclease signature motif containing protein [Serinibacter arcticus]|uniref:HNH endonuclease signature motif containing protein n=1 Tax=Serinibacter arcticus TaxID=1655435 RepID=UPI001304DAC7|nr:HNH endonuclease signature motif containing protein [Serinibacter arcticus]
MAAELVPRDPDAEPGSTACDALVWTAERVRVAVADLTRAVAGAEAAVAALERSDEDDAGAARGSAGGLGAAPAGDRAGVRAGGRALAAVARGRARARRGEALTATLRVLDESVSVLQAARSGVVSMAKADGSWRTGRARTFAEWRAQATRQGRGAATAEERTADALAQLPLVKAATQDGAVTMGHAEVIGQVLAGSSERTRERMVAVERELLAAATAVTPPELRRSLTAMASAMEADSADHGFGAVRARRYLRLSSKDGGVRIEGLLDPVAGETLRTALDALRPVPAAGDERTGEQRTADAIEAMASNALSSGAYKAGAQVRPHLSILVPADTWLLLTVRRRQLCASAGGERAGRSGAAFAASGLDVEPQLAQLQDGTLIPFAALDVLACDALLQRVVLDAEGSPLDVGRTQRTFHEDLRRAILTRDRHCQFPGCTLRATWCEVHHLQFWENDGPTSLTNGITLCSRHHHAVHDDNLTIAIVRGGFAFTDAAGRPLGTTTRLADRLLVPRRSDPPLSQETPPPVLTATGGRMREEMPPRDGPGGGPPGVGRDEARFGGEDGPGPDDALL